MRSVAPQIVPSSESGTIPGLQRTTISAVTRVFDALWRCCAAPGKSSDAPTRHAFGVVGFGLQLLGELDQQELGLRIGLQHGKLQTEVGLSPVVFWSRHAGAPSCFVSKNAPPRSWFRASCKL